LGPPDGTEIHPDLPGGNELQELRLLVGAVTTSASREEHEPRLHALAERLERGPDALLKGALADLLALYEGKTFGSPLASQQLQRALIQRGS